MTVRFNSLLVLFALAQPLHAWELPSFSPKTWFTVGCGVYSVGTLFFGYKLIKNNAEYNRQKAEAVLQTDQYNKQKAEIQEKFEKNYSDLEEHIKKVNNDNGGYFPLNTEEGKTDFSEIADQFDLTTVVDGSSRTTPNLKEEKYQFLALTKFDEKEKMQNRHFATKRRMLVAWSDNAGLSDLAFRQSLIKVPTKFNIDTEDEWRKTFEHYKYVSHFQIKYEIFTGNNGATYIEKTPKYYEDQLNEISKINKPVPVKLKRFNATDKAAFVFMGVGAGLLGLGYKQL